jgi:hypothetical protein
MAAAGLLGGNLVHPEGWAPNGNPPRHLVGYEFGEEGNI